MLLSLETFLAVAKIDVVVMSRHIIVTRHWLAGRCSSDHCCCIMLRMLAVAVPLGHLWDVSGFRRLRPGRFLAWATGGSLALLPRAFQQQVSTVKACCPQSQSQN